MAFVIRSMSTTDYVPAGYGRPEQKPVPYHVYLKPYGKRAGAWWAKSLHEAMRFETEAEAIEEIGNHVLSDSAEVAPVDADARGLPTYWENQKARRNV